MLFLYGCIGILCRCLERKFDARKLEQMRYSNLHTSQARSGLSLSDKPDHRTSHTFSLLVTTVVSEQVGTGQSTDYSKLKAIVICAQVHKTTVQKMSVNCTFWLQSKIVSKHG